jgi:hypothetical protein
MSLGLGIFLASMFIGTVYLYVQTRDQWDWRKIWTRLLKSVGALVVIIVTLIISYFGYEKWENQPKLITSLEGISLGDPFSDVIFKHGAFDKVDIKNVAHRNANEEEFVNFKKRTMLGVVNGVVRNVSYHCKEKELDFTSVNHIRCGDSSETIYETFSKGVRVLCEKSASADKSSPVSRVYDVVEYGTRYLLVENKVETFIVVEKSELQGWVGFNWHPCN